MSINALRYLSLCSGVEAASLAWEPLGMVPAAFAEVDKFACAVLAHRWPHIPNLGDVSAITDSQLAELGGVDICIFGSPCQDFSVAGKRGGTTNADGTATRSGLVFDCIRTADRSGARWTIIENVPGLLSSRTGMDFAEVVGALSGARPDVPAAGWANSGFQLGPRGLVEWCVLDAQYAGVPQRRRRVFIVRDTGDWASRGPLLLESSSLQRNPPPSRKAGQSSAHAVAPCIGASGRGFERAGDTRGQDCVVAACLTSNYGKNPDNSDTSRGPTLVTAPLTGNPYADNESRESLLVPTLRAGGNATGGHRPPGTDVDTCESLVVTHFQDSEFGCREYQTASVRSGRIPDHSMLVTPLVTHSLRADGFDASEDGIGRGTPLVVRALACNTGPAGHDAGNFACNQAVDAGHVLAFESRFARNGRGAPSDVVPPLKAQSGQSGKGDGAPLVATFWDGSQTSQTIDAVTAKQQAMPEKNRFPAVLVPQAVQENMRAEVRLTDTVGALSSGGGKPGQGYPAVCAAISPPVSASGPPFSRPGNERNEAESFVTHGMIVRRLTVKECERLQGFPDGHTDVPYRGKRAADGPRYRAIGNSFAVPVVSWIGRRILAVENALQRTSNEPTA